MEVICTNSIKRDIGNLEKRTISKVIRAIMLLERYGFKLRMPHSKKITDKLYELRVKGRQEVRIFYTYKRTTAILLHLFIKKVQKTPEREIQTALNKLNQID